MTLVTDFSIALLVLLVIAIAGWLIYKWPKMKG